jgi:hypothetical protein
VRHEHEVAVHGALRDEPADRCGLDRLTPPVVEERIERLPALGAAEREPRGVDAPAPAAREHPADGDAARSERLAQQARLLAPCRRQVPLRRAVTEAELRRVAEPRLRGGVPHDDDLAATLEQAPHALAVLRDARGRAERRDHHGSCPPGDHDAAPIAEGPPGLVVLRPSGRAR